MPELINITGGVLALVLAVGSAGSLSLDEALSILGDLQSGDADVAGVDWDSDGGAVGLVLRNLLDVDAVSQSIDLGDLSLGAFHVSVHDLDFVILSHRQTLDQVLFSQLGAQVGTQKTIF